MKTIFTVTLALFTSLLFADSHIIIKQNGEKMEVNYVMTKGNVVYYSIPGNSSMNEISTYAVQKVIDKSNNQVVLEYSKPDVSGKNGYKNVQLINEEQTDGLNKQTSLKTVIHKAKGQSKASWETQAQTRIKKQAADQGFPYVVITKQTNDKIEAVGYSF